MATSDHLHPLTDALAQVPPDVRAIAPQSIPQMHFLQCDADVAVYGGAAGGGKTWALCVDALRYAALEPVAGFGAVIFRKSSPQITQEGGLWDEASKLYPLVDGKPNQVRLEWAWPQHKTRIRFGHLNHEQDRFNWQGAQIAYIGFDELTHFSEDVFFYLFSRNRSLSGVKPRIRATTNPDPDSWVKTFLAPWVDDTYPDPAAGGEIRWFYRESGEMVWLRHPDLRPRHVSADDLKSCTFIPASIYDNPALLKANPQYLASLKALPLVERKRLLEGDWNIRSGGNKFQRHWFPICSAPGDDDPNAPHLPPPADFTRVVRAWDLAATEPKPGTDPDWTVGVKLARSNAGQFYVLDVVRARLSPLGVEQLIQRTAQQDGSRVTQYVEQEPGSSGKMLVDRLIRLLAGYPVHAVKPTGDKELRANPLSAQAEAGHVSLVRAPWNDALLNELAAFPQTGVHDDSVDALALAFNQCVAGQSLSPDVVALMTTSGGAGSTARPGQRTPARPTRPSGGTIGGAGGAGSNGLFGGADLWRRRF